MIGAYILTLKYSYDLQISQIDMNIPWNKIFVVKCILEQIKAIMKKKDVHLLDPGFIMAETSHHMM